MVVVVVVLVVVVVVVGTGVVPGAFVAEVPVVRGGAAAVSMEADPLPVATVGTAIVALADASARSGTDGEHAVMASANTTNTWPRPAIFDLVNNSSK